MVVVCHSQHFAARAVHHTSPAEACVDLIDGVALQKMNHAVDRCQANEVAAGVHPHEAVAPACRSLGQIDASAGWRSTLCH